MAGKRGVDLLGRPYFDSGYIPCSDWTDRYLGTGAGKNVDSVIDHGLNAPLSDLSIVLLYSPDGKDSGIELFQNTAIVASGSHAYGWVVGQMDSNDEVLIQTGKSGLLRLTGSGAADGINTEDAFYRIIITKERD